VTELVYAWDGEADRKQSISCLSGNRLDTVPGKSPILIEASRQNPVKVSLLLACYW